MPDADPTTTFPSTLRHLAATALALLLAGCDQPSKTGAQAPPPPKVTVAKPVVREIQESDEFTGRFDAVASVEIRARVGGFLDSVRFTDGAEVKEGDLLFMIDRRPFQAALNAAEATATSAQTRLDLAKLELERADRLSRTGAAAERTLDQARQQFLSAQADISGAQAAVETARLNLSFTEIRAPISGRIGRTLVTAGNLVDANTTLLTTLVALDPIHFYFDIDERAFLAQARGVSDTTVRSAAIPVGTSVAVALSDEASPTHTGRLDFVDNRLDQATGTLRGRAVFENHNHLLIPGLFGRIRIPRAGVTTAILIPDEAIAADLDRRTVMVVGADGTVAPRTVVPGSRIDGYRLIRQGLTGEDLVVINGTQRARPGSRVTPELATLLPSR